MQNRKISAGGGFGEGRGCFFVAAAAETEGVQLLTGQEAGAGGGLHTLQQAT